MSPIVAVVICIIRIGAPKLTVAMHRLILKRRVQVKNIGKMMIGVTAADRDLGATPDLISQYLKYSHEYQLYWPLE